MRRKNRFLLPLRLVCRVGFAPGAAFDGLVRKEPHDGVFVTTVADGVPCIVNENPQRNSYLYIDLDEKGNLVNMTIEHAKEKAGISEVSFLQMEKTNA